MPGIEPKPQSATSMKDSTNMCDPMGTRILSRNNMSQLESSFEDPRSIVPVCVDISEMLQAVGTNHIKKL